LNELAATASGEPRRVARRWWQSRRGRRGKLGLAFVSGTSDELRQVAQAARDHLRARPDTPAAYRFFYSPTPLGGDVAFVYPGSGNHFPGMGRDLGAALPHVLWQQMGENQLLASQYHAQEVWRSESLDHLAPRELIFAQVALGTLVSDLLVSFGVKPRAAIPYSLGESAMLFGTRAWRDRDEMFRRMQASSLFASDLAGRCDAARAKWGLPADQPVDWLTGVISAPAVRVREVIAPGDRVYVQIVNTADDCVIGGERSAVEDVVRVVGASFVEVRGVSTAHCEVAEPVRDAYRALHVLPTHPPTGVRYYSGAWGRAYELNDQTAADAITAAAMDTIDFPRVVNAAYADGARVFVEVGPGASCTRMIGSILAGRPHLARAACAPRQDAASVMLRLLANLHAEGVAVDLDVLYGGPEPAEKAESGPSITLRVGYHPKPVKRREPVPEAGIGIQLVRQAERVMNTPPLPAPACRAAVRQVQGGQVANLSPLVGTPVTVLAETQTATMQAHDAYLRFATTVQGHFARTVAWQTAVLQEGPANPGTAAVPAANGAPTWYTITSDGERVVAGTAAVAGGPAPLAPRQGGVPRTLDFGQCTEFARGLVGNVLGPKYAEVDSFPTRVRLPDGPLQLVDRVLTIEGEPLSLEPGRVVTDHLVHKGRWYLEHDRIPACISIEAGQADLFLSGFLGIDFKTRGLACYRLLDAAVTFHRELPNVGDQIRYDIRIDHFFRQGDTYLFRFRFDGTVNGEPLLTMRDGCAGFFTAEELAAGKGVVHTALDLKPVPGKAADGWAPHVPLRDESLAEAQVDALRAGDLVAAFGPEFAAARLRDPMRLPGEMLRLVHRVERIEPAGGRYGLGRIRCEADIRPDDWFLTCHFVDDQVMPGTLMYECCLHTMRVLLMRMGWVTEDREARFEPVPGVASRLRCRGQVTASTKKVTYEVSLKEVGFRPEPHASGDALMYADGKPIVEVKDISLRLVGMTRERLDEIWGGRTAPRAETRVGLTLRVRNDHAARDDSRVPVGARPLPHAEREANPVFTRYQVLEFATGSPSKAFGDRYRPFDRDRFIARLPGPPFSFLDRVTRFDNGEQWRLAPGAAVEAEYTVPADAWYFAANRCDRMPYSVLNEIALQACGWTCAYLGSALTSPDDLHFRNLGGNATQHAAVRPDAGTLTTRVKLTRVSPAAGMIILAFDFDVRRGATPVYSGDTTFGFFTKSALANQVGLANAKLLVPGPAEAGGWTGPVPSEPPFPDDMLRMVDTVRWCAIDGGPKGLGSVEGRARVNPDAWFFKAHFFQDPVWPGSLGLESLVQLMKVYAHRRWGPPADGWQAMATGRSHRWAYRGQIVPAASEVTVQAYITGVDDDRRIVRADGLLAVDGRIIYQMSDFTLEG
jgi:3-hydroxymyristoyl/3-hydroxydecanoyl-(acyl carrier protein) dehydratase/malonyl CoA-acyl carrier protein transacylase